MTLKESLIWLTLQGLSYHQLRCFLNTLVTKELFTTDLTLNDLKIVHRSIDYGPKIKRPTLEFTLTDEDAKAIKLYAPQTLMIAQDAYPNEWLELPQPPLLIYYQGNLSLLKKPMVSVIGTRKMTDYGKKMTQQIVEALVEQDICVVSGLALGVDQIAHQTVVQRKGNTIGIIASGYDHFYPRQNLPLQMAMMKDQLILSEYLPHIGVRKHHFVMRNRLVAGLTPATIVIEAAHGSGSLITANYAIQFNRELFVLPGRITDSQSGGCNDLISLGANPILSIYQLVDELTQLLSRTSLFEKSSY